MSSPSLEHYLVAHEHSVIVASRPLHSSHMPLTIVRLALFSHVWLKILTVFTHQPGCFDLLFQGETFQSQLLSVTNRLKLPTHPGWCTLKAVHINCPMRTRFLHSKRDNSKAADPVFVDQWFKLLSDWNVVIWVPVTSSEYPNTSITVLDMANMATQWVGILQTFGQGCNLLAAQSFTKMNHGSPHWLEIAVRCIQTAPQRRNTMSPCIGMFVA